MHSPGGDAGLPHGGQPRLGAGLTGCAAVLELSARFDRVRPATVRVPGPALAEALEALDPAVRAALETSVERARTVHAEQRRTDVVTQVVPGGVVSERFVPVRRVGRPEDVAHTASFLASEAAGFVSGQVIYVAGGPLC